MSKWQPRHSFHPPFLRRTDALKKGDGADQQQQQQQKSVPFQSETAEVATTVVVAVGVEVRVMVGQLRAAFAEETR